MTRFSPSPLQERLPEPPPAPQDAVKAVKAAASGSSGNRPGPSLALFARGLGFPGRERHQSIKESRRKSEEPHLFSRWRVTRLDDATGRCSRAHGVTSRDGNSFVTPPAPRFASQRQVPATFHVRSASSAQPFRKMSVRTMSRTRTGEHRGGGDYPGRPPPRTASACHDNGPRPRWGARGAGPSG